VSFGLRSRIAVTALAASAAALLAVLVIVGPALRQRATGRTRETLLAEARLMAHVAGDALGRGAGSDELDRIVDEAAREVRARVTIIGMDGRVLADSALSGPALLAVENHRDRPEVQQALAEGAGSSIRRSSTVKEDLLYVAVPMRRGGRIVGICRVALSLAGVYAEAAELRRAVIFALVLAFLLTAALSILLASPLAGPLRRIMDAARQFAAGNLEARIQVRRADELGELAQILNQSAAQLQERLAENARERARTEAILSTMDDGVLAVDHRGTVLLANEAFRRVLGLKAPGGRHYLEALREREVGAVIDEVLTTGERRVAEVEVPRLRRAFAVTGIPFPGSEGAPPGVVLTFHDVTERRRLDQVRRDFVANASHELRTPLTSIRGFVEALEDGALGEPDTATRFLGKIRTHADRMAALVEDLLELSRLESGESPPRWELLAPAEVAEEVVASLSDLAARRRITLRCQDGGAPSVTTDADRLRRILVNLTDNAVKYTPEAGHVEVSCAAGDDGSAVLAVRDDGPGIAAEHLPRIFERFYRVDKARSRELGGTGLGLSIVRHLAEGMGASVAVASEIGRGSTFTVLLPRDPQAG
jgi:two-component system phosphate regulon sensor histidine kinase PhoR